MASSGISSVTATPAVTTVATTTSAMANSATVAMSNSITGSFPQPVTLVEQKPPPDVLLTSTTPPSLTDSSRTQSTVPEARIRLACMEGQLAHLSAWVQVLQQSPGAPVNAKHLAGYSHRNCANNTCRVTADAINTADRESNYTPSNSSLDSAYSARSTTSSESISAKQLAFEHETLAQTSPHIPVLVTAEQGPLNGHTVTATPPATGSGFHSPHGKATSPPQTLGSLAPDYCPLFALPNYSALIDHPTSATKASLQMVKSRLKATQTDVSHLKSELSGLRRAHTTCMAQHKENTENVIERIKQMIARVDGLDLSLIQQARLAMNRQLELYEQEVQRANAWLKDLDTTIEDLRMVALTRRCRISVSEVEMLALHVNRVSFRLRNFKRIESDLLSSLTVVGSTALEITSNYPRLE
ncbi:unnamed protein product [Echinostoma caproni]|uniref:AIP3 domain-containing protein n=1 Tax=Echinostoma caproni TaxID=27848 RepID=A0A183A560_9TREM|nr:unnamed protein product [Echinostoma caproni]